MLDALEKSLCVVTTACKMVDMPRSMHYQWMKEDEEYKNNVEALENIVLDFAESKLHKQVEKGDTTAIIFLLKTKGKKRGYIERVEQVVENTKPMVIIKMPGEK